MIMRALLFSLALLNACAAPAPLDPMAPLRPLMGCWRGTFEDQPNIHDERCFEPLGEHLVDRHYVRPTQYWGETTYHYDDAQREIIWAYAASDGGRSNGAVTARGAALVFPEHAFQTASGGELRLRSTWTFEGPDRFTAVSERFDNGAWVAFMRITYQRAPATE